MISLSHLTEAMPISLRTGLPLGRVLVASGYLNQEKFRQVLSVQSLVRERRLSTEQAVAVLSLINKNSLGLMDALRELGIDDAQCQASTRFGDLLKDAQLLDTAQINDAVAVSLATDLPLARIILGRGLLFEQLLYLALLGQELLRDGKLSRNSLLNSLTKVAQAQEKGELIVRKVHIDRAASLAYQAHSVRLGELLSMTTLIEEDKLLCALEESLSQDKPLGRTLLKHKLITRGELEKLLQVQKLVSNGTLNINQAAYLLSQVQVSGIDCNEPAENLSKDETPIIELSPDEGWQAEQELQALLSGAGIINQLELQQARAVIVQEHVSLEKALSQLGFFPENTDFLDALLLCQLVDSGKISHEQALFALQITACPEYQGRLEILLKELAFIS
jgi:chorismate-pyruvate lyase